MTDDEYLSHLSNIEIYAELLLGILRYTSVKNYSDDISYRKELTKKLKFEKDSDSDLFRACIDLLEDTQYAINDVFTNGLITNINSQGEIYLRLYGVLNAYYLQLGTIIDLMRLFNFKEQKRIREELKTSKIIELRNKLGSHTTNYKVSSSEKETDFYRLAQSTINKWGNSLLIVGKNKSEEINLIEIMREFTIKIEQILETIVNKELYNRSFKMDHFSWLEYRYKFVNKRK